MVMVLELIGKEISAFVATCLFGAIKKIIQRLKTPKKGNDIRKRFTALLWCKVLVGLVTWLGEDLARHFAAN